MSAACLGMSAAMYQPMQAVESSTVNNIGTGRESPGLAMVHRLTPSVSPAWRKFVAIFDTSRVPRTCLTSQEMLGVHLDSVNTKRALNGKPRTGVFLGP